MCLELCSCVQIFTSFYRCWFCIPKTKATHYLPLLDLFELILCCLLISATLLWQDTWFGHLLIIVPSLTIAVLLKLFGVAPYLLFSTQKSTSDLQQQLWPFMVYSFFRSMALAFLLSGFMLQLAFSVVAI